MTREDAIALLNKHNDDDVVDVLVVKQFINQIYDDFEKTKQCTACGCKNFNEKILKEGTWMGTKCLPSEFFRKSEYDFGWDYYPKKDTIQSTCTKCGLVVYSVDIR